MSTTKPTSPDLADGRHFSEARPRRGYRARLLALAALTALVAAACRSSEPPVVGHSTDGLDQTVLGTAQSFAVLGGTMVTSVGATTIAGNLGVDPGLAITGFPPGLVVGGVIHAGDAVALQAQTDTTTAYDVLAGQAPTLDLTGQDLGGKTLTAGVYRFSSSAQLTGMLTLDAQGDPKAVFVFQIGSTLTTASNSSVVGVNGAVDCNVFWQVGSSATLGTTTALRGNILALTSITLDTGATVSGRVLARNAAVTMDANGVSMPSCATLADAGTDSGGLVDAGRDAGQADTGSDSAADGAASDSSLGGDVCDAGVAEAEAEADAGEVDACDGAAD
jgi:hypothetical protein